MTSTVAALHAEASAALEAAGVESAAWDAERLLRHVLGWDRAAFLARPEAGVGRDAEARFRALVARRAAREPLQYIVGSQAFWKHEFLVTPDVLIPRPETELLVETSLELLRAVARPLVVDVGTGSGCIALSLAAERPDAEVHATDVSEPALAVARENARRLGLAGRVAFHHGHLLEPVAALAGRIDLVVSNPPYVDPAEREALAPELRDHEPAGALHPLPRGGATDAASLYRELALAAAAVLRPGRFWAVEIGAQQAGRVASVLEGSGLSPREPVADLQGLPRVLIARRSD